MSQLDVMVKLHVYLFQTKRQSEKYQVYPLSAKNPCKNDTRTKTRQYSVTVQIRINAVSEWLIVYKMLYILPRVDVSRRGWPMSNVMDVSCGNMSMDAGGGLYPVYLSIVKKRQKLLQKIYYLICSFLILISIFWGFQSIIIIGYVHSLYVFLKKFNS